MRLRECILNGDWDLSLHLLNKMSSFVPQVNLERIRCKFLEEKYVELLANNRVWYILRFVLATFPEFVVFIFYFFLHSFLENSLLDFFLDC